MALLYIDRANYTANTEFRERIRIALIIRALAIHGEPLGGMAQGRYDKRQALATRVLEEAYGGNDLVMKFVWTMVAAYTTGDPEQDALLITLIDLVWDDLAGVTITDV